MKIKPPTGPFYKDIPYTFDSESSDPAQFGNPLPCSVLQWTIFGVPGFPKAGLCKVTVVFPEAKSYLVKLEGTGSAFGASDIVTITVLDKPSGLPPTVKIVDPPDGLNPYQMATSKGKATGKDPISYKWVLAKGEPTTGLIGDDDNDGQITLKTGTTSSGQEFSFQWKPADHVYSQPGGVYVKLRLEVTDAGGKTAVDEVKIYIEFPLT